MAQFSNRRKVNWFYLICATVGAGCIGWVLGFAIGALIYGL